MKREESILDGMRFGEWTVYQLSPHTTKDNRLIYDCVCTCSTKRPVKGDNLTTGKSTSCGCKRNVKTDKRHKHNMYGTPVYMVWANMKKNHKGDIDPSWTGFSAFFKDMGKKPRRKSTLHRVDKGKPFSKDNCKWLTREEIETLKITFI